MTKIRSVQGLSGREYLGKYAFRMVLDVADVENDEDVGVERKRGEERVNRWSCSRT